MFNINIRRADIVRNKLNKASVYLKQGFNRETGEEMLEHLFSSTPSYPPELPGQQYVRTYNLYDALRAERGQHRMSLSEVRAIGGEQTVILGLRGGSNTLYGSEVVGFPEQQKPIHRGRWFTLISHVTKQIGSLTKIVRKGSRDLLKKAGF